MCPPVTFYMCSCTDASAIECLSVNVQALRLTVLQKSGAGASLARTLACICGN